MQEIVNQVYQEIRERLATHAKGYKGVRLPLKDYLQARYKHTTLNINISPNENSTYFRIRITYPHGVLAYFELWRPV